MASETLQSCGQFGVFRPPVFILLSLSLASRSERTVACTIRRDLVFKMELQFALLLAGIIAFSDSARGKEPALCDSHPSLRSIGIKLQKHSVPSERPCKAAAVGAVGVNSAHCLSGPLVWMERGRSAFAEVS